MLPLHVIPRSIAYRLNINYLFHFHIFQCAQTHEKTTEDKKINPDTIPLSYSWTVCCIFAVVVITETVLKKDWLSALKKSREQNEKHLFDHKILRVS